MSKCKFIYDFLFLVLTVASILLAERIEFLIYFNEKIAEYYIVRGFFFLCSLFFGKCRFLTLSFLK